MEQRAVGARRRRARRRHSLAKLSSASSSSDEEETNESYSQFRSRRRRLRHARQQRDGATPRDDVALHQQCYDQEALLPGVSVASAGREMSEGLRSSRLVHWPRSRSLATSERFLWIDTKPPTIPTASCESRQEGVHSVRFRRRSGSCQPFKSETMAPPRLNHNHLSLGSMDDLEAGCLQNDDEEEVEFDEELVLKTCHDFIHDYNHQCRQGLAGELGRNRSQSLTLMEHWSTMDTGARRRTITTAPMVPKSILKKSSEDLLDLDSRTPVPILKHRATSSGSLLSHNGVNSGGILKRKSSGTDPYQGDLTQVADDRASRRSEHIRIRSPSPLSSSSSSAVTPTTPKSILRSRTNSSEDSRRRSSLASSPLLDEALPIQGILKQRRHSLGEGLALQSNRTEETQQGILKRRANSAVSGSNAVDHVLGILKKQGTDLTNDNSNNTEKDDRVRPILKKSSTVASEEDGEPTCPTKSILKTRRSEDLLGDNDLDFFGLAEAGQQRTQTIKPILRRPSRDDIIESNSQEKQVWSAPVSCVSTPLKLCVAPSLQPSSSSSHLISPRRFSSGSVEVTRLYHRIKNFDNEDNETVVVHVDDEGQPEIQTSTFSINIEETPLNCEPELEREANETVESSSTDESSLSSDCLSSSNFAAVLDSVPSGRDSPSGRDLVCSNDDDRDDDDNNEPNQNGATTSTSRSSGGSFTCSQRRPVIPLSRVKLNSDDPELAAKLEIIADAAEAIRRKMSLNGCEPLAPDDSEPLLPAFLKN